MALEGCVLATATCGGRLWANLDWGRLQVTRIRAIQHTQRYYRLLNGSFTSTHRNLFQGCSTEMWPSSLPPAWPYLPWERALAAFLATVLATLAWSAWPCYASAQPFCVLCDSASPRSVVRREREGRGCLSIEHRVSLGRVKTQGEGGEI